MTRIIQSLRIGFRRRPWRIPVTAFFAYSALWTVLESASYLDPQLAPKGEATFIAMLAISVTIGVVRTYPKRSCKIRIRALDLDVNLQFGDLFAQPGIRVVPFNEFFDVELGDHVSPASLQGKFIGTHFHGSAADLRARLVEDLSEASCKEVGRPSGSTYKYPIGTTARVMVEPVQYLLLALSKTNTSTLKASCDIPQLWAALAGLWSAVRNRAGGRPVYVPLVGGGLSGLGIPPSQLAALLVLSAVNASKRDHLGSTIHLVLPETRFSEIDLTSIRDIWT